VVELLASGGFRGAEPAPPSPPLGDRLTLSLTVKFTLKYNGGHEPEVVTALKS